MLTLPVLPLMTAHANLFKGKKVLLRLDLNVPLLMNEIRSDFRLKTSLPTINFLRSMGAKVVIMSHLGSGNKEESLRPVCDYLSKMMPITFLDRLTDAENINIINNLRDGDVAMLENLRMDSREASNDPEFVSYLASLGDYYINDAFAVSHRDHASVTGLAKALPSFAGMRLAEEAGELSRAFDPAHPFLFIMGGGKIKTKITLLKNLGEKADHIFLGGIIANNFLKAKGYNVGVSVCDCDDPTMLKDLIDNPRFIIPSDVVVKGGSESVITKVGEVGEHEMIVDIGRETISSLESIIGEAKFIIWNGPLGFYEDGYSDGSRELIERISGSNAYTIIGGGDTVALIESMGKSNSFGFISTGGSAMLDYLTNGNLIGLQALRGLE